MTQTKEQEECPLCFEQCTDPPTPHDTERARAFLSAWFPAVDLAAAPNSDAAEALAQALSDERNDRERSLVASFMCGIAAVTSGTPAEMVAQLCTVHQPLVIDAMGYLQQGGESVVRLEKTPEAHARDIAAARAKRDRKARR